MLITKEKSANNVSEASLCTFDGTIRFNGKKGDPYIKDVQVYDKGTLIWEGNSSEFFSIFIRNRNVF